MAQIDEQLARTLGTFNEEFFDAMIRHQIGLLRFSSNTQNQILKLLDATETDIANQITRGLRNNKGFASPRSVVRAEATIAAVKATRITAWKQVDEVWFTEMIALSKQNPTFVQGLLNTIIPVELGTVLPPPAQLEALVRFRPFQGKTLRGWARDIRAADLKRIEDQIKIGMVQGETSQQIARRVVGTKAQAGRNGVTEITRRQAEAITRTATTAFSNASNREFYKLNEKLFKEELYTATLDSRTTPICQSLDGERFPVGEGPIPPVHIRCRSVRVAIIGKDAVGSRPVRPFTQQQLVREFSAKRGLSGIKTRAGLPRGTKGDFDKFSRTRMRQLTGTAPAKISYQEWLGKQANSFQDDVLGKTRAILFRKGNLKLDRFVNRAGDQIPLKELAKMHRSAFKSAGLDPENFL
jgi:SPP1 gp7 family putative phage head morphogenesis protein